MAETRRTGGARHVPSRGRRPARAGQREALGDDPLEPAGFDEQDAAEEDMPEAAEPDGHDDADEAPEPAGRDGYPADGEARRTERTARRSDPALTVRKAATAALRQVVELTAKRAEGITDIERNEDGWTVGIEVIEDARIPSSADILATYQARIDRDGQLMSYRRLRRYSRGRGDNSQGL